MTKLIYLKVHLNLKKKNVFEDQSQPRILNSDSRLKDLQEYLNKKGTTKEGSDGKELKKMKLTQESPYQETSGENSETEENEIIRGFSSSLVDIIQGGEELNSQEEWISDSQTVHCLFLPFSFETDQLFSKKNLVNLFFLLN